MDVCNLEKLKEIAGQIGSSGLVGKLARSGYVDHVGWSVVFAFLTAATIVAGVALRRVVARVSDLAYQGGNLVTIWAVCGILVATFIVGVFVNIVTAWQFIEMPEAMVLRSLLSRVGH